MDKECERLSQGRVRLLLPVQVRGAACRAGLFLTCHSRWQRRGRISTLMTWAPGLRLLLKTNILGSFGASPLTFKTL